MAQPPNPKASIVYLTFNGGDLLKRSLEAVFAQRVYFEFEVIAVDSGSTDGTLDLLQSLPVHVSQIPPDEFNFGLTRDLGFSLAKGDILIAISQDAVPVGDTWLADMISPFMDESVAAVQGVDIVPKGQPAFYWHKIKLFYLTRDSIKWQRWHQNIALSFTSCALRRAVWEENSMGRVEMSEDKVFQKKIMARGHKIVVQLEAKDYHSHMYDLASLSKRCENEGVGWRGVDLHYTLLDTVKDIFNPLMFLALVFGLFTFQIRSLAELLFPIIRPLFLFKGNHFTKTYVR